MKVERVERDERDERVERVDRAMTGWWDDGQRKRNFRSGGIEVGPGIIKSLDTSLRHRAGEL